MIVYNVRTQQILRNVIPIYLASISCSKLEERFMDMPTTSLSMEQQFKLQVLRDQVKTLSQDQAQEYLIEVMRQNMVKENLFKYWMKKL